MKAMHRLSSVLAVAIGCAACSAAAPGTATAAQVTQDVRITMSDGVGLAATLTGQAPLSARPSIIEFSPYGPGTASANPGGAYNYLLVQLRGTGDSDGRFDALGPRTQQDVQQSLRWACRQPWSDGRLGLMGFSASAIAVYNALHLALPCVKGAVLKSGTFELYRDLLYPGGISNFLPGAGVLALIGGDALTQGGARLQRSPATGFDTTIGLTDAGLSDLGHPTLDSFWQQRGFRGEVNRLPILMIDGWFDVESRGAFQAYQALRRDGAHLLVVGGHDGAPSRTDAGLGATEAWFDHYVRGVENRIENQPRVQLLLAEGSRESYLAGAFERYAATDWPIPSTRWTPLWLSAVRDGQGATLDQGSLVASRPSAGTAQSYSAIPTLPTASDVPNTGFAGPMGLNYADTALPLLTETTLGQPLSLSYTSPPLRSSLTSAGPASLDLALSSSAPETGLWAVISDVWPDGGSHPLTSGRLLSSFPDIIASRSLTDAAGDVVEPYGDYGAKTYTAPGALSRYQIEFWPIGNVFRPGDRIQLTILGASAASSPGTPAVNSVQVGGAEPSRLLLPVVPTSSAVSAFVKRALVLSVVPSRLEAGRRVCLRLKVMSQGRPVRGARVRVGSRSAHTGRDGVARLCVRLRSGRHLAVATAGGYQASRVALTVRRAARRPR